jgi:hypothetical protein
MGTLMIHDQNEDGQVALSEATIAGEHTPARRYDQIGHFLHIDGPLHALAHDLDQVKQLGYRLATAAEQNLFAKQQKKAATIQESAPEGDNK